MIKNNDKWLVTFDRWFIAPDGNMYQAAWGTVEILNDAFLGIKTNRNSTNWYVQIGKGENKIVVAGCQVHYAVCSNQTPETAFTKTFTTDEKSSAVYKHKAPTRVYLAE